MTPEQRDAWIAEQLAKSPDHLTAAQQAELRRLLLPAKPVSKPA
jgi:hypothetical protein